MIKYSAVEVVVVLLTREQLRLKNHPKRNSKPTLSRNSSSLVIIATKRSFLTRITRVKGTTMDKNEVIGALKIP